MFPTMGSWWSMADGKVVIDTGLDTSGFEKGVKSLPSKTSGITSSLKGIAGAAAAAFSVKAIVDFGKAAVEIGSNIAEVQNVVDTSFGDMSYKVEAFVCAVRKKDRVHLYVYGARDGAERGSRLGYVHQSGRPDRRRGFVL